MRFVFMLERNQIPFEESQEVFQPVSSSSHKHVSDKLLQYSTDGNSRHNLNPTEIKAFVNFERKLMILSGWVT